MKNKICFFLALLWFSSSCSTTKKLTGDEVLYVGVKKMEIKTRENSNWKAGKNLPSRPRYPIRPTTPYFHPTTAPPFPLDCGSTTGT